MTAAAVVAVVLVAVVAVATAVAAGGRFGRWYLVEHDAGGWVGDRDYADPQSVVVGRYWTRSGANAGAVRVRRHGTRGVTVEHAADWEAEHG